MEGNFFTLNTTIEAIKEIHNDIKIIETNLVTDKKKIGYLTMLLSSFVSDPANWDKQTPFNIKHISSKILSFKFSENDPISDMNMLYVICFRFFIERAIRDPSSLKGAYSEYRSFTIENKDSFHHPNDSQISYALLAMPLDMFEERFNGENITLINTFIEKQNKIAERESIWNQDMDAREARVNALKEAFDEKEDAFNFVGLHDGFKNLGVAKKEELESVTLLMKILGVAILLPIIGEFIFILIKGENLNITQSVISAIPATSLLLVLIYYFRVALQDYKSIKAQINQIELRKSLCMFIQSYTKYSKEMKSDDGSALDKFENIIFSNIVMSDEKLPSTFDGLDSIASIVKEVKIRPLVK